MSGFSTVDGLVEISESLAKMIKYMANEPSVGLFYIQQHTQKAVPNLISRRHDVVVKSRETTLHTEDLEDSIAMVKSMKEYGSSIADEMIKDINRSLVILSTKPLEKTSSGAHDISNQPDAESTNYFSSIFKSAKQKTINIKRPKVGIGEFIQENVLPSFSNGTAAVQSTVPVTEADRLHLRRYIAEDIEESQDDTNIPSENSSSIVENYDNFKAHKEAKLQKWLEGVGN